MKSNTLIGFCILILRKAALQNTEYRPYSVFDAYLLTLGISARTISYGDFFYAQLIAQGLGDNLSLNIKTLTFKIQLIHSLPAE